MAYFLDPDLAKLVRDEQASSSGPSGKGSVATRKTTSTPQRIRTNKFAASCSKCGERVPAGQGSLEMKNGAWVTTHLEC